MQQLQIRDARAAGATGLAAPLKFFKFKYKFVYKHSCGPADRLPVSFKSLALIICFISFVPCRFVGRSGSDPGSSLTVCAQLNRTQIKDHCILLLQSRYIDTITEFNAKKAPISELKITFSSLSSVFYIV